MDMSNQKRLIPSTSMLMAFDSAARTGSFTAAAREINLTQGAVSRQIHALEEQLGITLFRRIRKSIQLTEVGIIYAQEVHRALQLIRNATLNAITNPLSGTLNLAILPTFGTRWLMPRFPMFLQEHPDVTVNFVSKLAPFNFQDENLHAAIHYGRPDWPATESTFLMGEESIPVCSPSLLNQHSINTPADLISLSLLRLSSRANAWENWLSSNGVSVPVGQGMLFEQFSIIAQAAVAGLGVALLPKFLIQHELDKEELIVIFNTPLKSEAGYYLVSPIDKSKYAPVTAFRDWLLKMTGQ